jgi:hypothetical protein
MVSDPRIRAVAAAARYAKVANSTNGRTRYPLARTEAARRAAWRCEVRESPELEPYRDVYMRVSRNTGGRAK